jgi:acetolactate synthase I/II/III large subunit
VAIPELTALVTNLLGQRSDRADLIQKRRARVSEARATVRKRWAEEAQHENGKTPISHAQLTQATWNVIKNDKYVVSGNTAGWVRRIFDMDRPGCANWGIGGAAALGSNLPKAVGAGVAAKDEDAFCVAFNGDGDFLYVPSTIWTAVHHQIPVLFFVLNNGGYIGEGGHQHYISSMRERSLDRLDVAIEFKGPQINYTDIARGLGAYTEGPITNPDDLEPAIKRAFQVMKEKSTMAVLDVTVGD